MLTFGRTIREVGAAIQKSATRTRTFNMGLNLFTAKTGTTSKGVKWTKLYNDNGDLVSWKQAFNGKIKKGRYEKVDIFDWNKGVSSEISGNKKLTTVKFDGFEAEKYPSKTSSSFSSLDDPFNPMNKYDPLSPNYEPFSFNSDDLLNNSWNI